MVQVVPVDVPGVEVPGVVRVELEQVAPCARGEHLPLRLVVPYRHDQAGCVVGDAEDAVVQVAVAGFDRGGVGSGVSGVAGAGGRRPAAPGHGQDGQLPVGQLDRLAAVVGGLVEGDQVVAFRRGQVELGALDDPARSFQDGGVLDRGVPVHPGDAGAGDDVVELVDQQQLPEGLEGLVGRAAVEAGGHRPQLGGPQSLLRSPVAQLHVGVGGRGGPVVLEVELADPGRQTSGPCFLGDVGQEAAQLPDTETGQAVGVP